jgi:hypothetical protein
MSSIFLQSSPQRATSRASPVRQTASRGAHERGCGERGKGSIAFDATCLVEVDCRSGPHPAGFAVPKKPLPRSGGAFSWKRRACRCAPVALCDVCPRPSISSGAGLAGTIRLRLSGPMAVGVISARANIRHHTALVTGNSPPIRSALPPGGVPNSAVTLSTISPIGGVRSRCHEKSGSTQHQQMLHDRLLLMRASPRLHAPVLVVFPHHTMTFRNPACWRSGSCSRTDAGCSRRRCPR